MQRRKVFPSESEPVISLGGFLQRIAAVRKLWVDEGDLTSRGDEKGLWYRGHGNDTWGLTPKRWRKDYAKENEAEMRLEFESVGRQLVLADSQRDKWGWYFLMAHYGAPTRLLDWTVNPLIALYFAVTSAQPGTNAAVWIVDPWNWNKVHIPDLYGPALPGWKETEPYLWELEDAMDTDNRDVRRKWPIAIEPPHIDKRIAAQEGRFVLFGTARDMVLSPNVNRRGRGKKTRLDKVVIPVDKLESLRDELNRISVNSKTVFPDLAGLGQHICWKWKTFK